MIVLPGGGYAEHAPYEAEPIADWLTTLAETWIHEQAVTMS
jgi:hypothetical protein